MRKSIKAIITIIFILFISGVVTFLFTFRWLLNTPEDSNGHSGLFEVKNGESTFQIAEHLKNRGIIRADWVFFLNAKMKGVTLLPGIYELSPSMNILRVYQIISTGETKVVKVTIPEGYRTEQIAQILDQKKIVDYASFMKKAKAYDGKLFPDTYYLTPDNTVDQIIEMMQKDYAERIAGLTVTDQDLIIASIVEREAITDSDRALIAGIYKNRIAKKMKLESDPTVRYALDNEIIKNLPTAQILSFAFWKQKVILSEVRTFNSPYNTYFADGLPPAPICNPGLSSINAVVNSLPSNYYYFLNDSNGKIYPAKDLLEHNQNIKKYMGN